MIEVVAFGSEAGLTPLRRVGQGRDAAQPARACPALADDIAVAGRFATPQGLFP